MQTHLFFCLLMDIKDSNIKLDNFILINRGRNYHKLDKDGIEIIKTKQIQKDSIYNKNSYIYTNIFSDNNLIRKNEIVMSVTGEGRGKINLIKEPRVLIDSTLINIKSFDKKIIDEIYLFYFLKSRIKLLKEKAEGSSIKSIKLLHLKNIKIPIIDINKQKLIGDFFNKIDQLIENNRLLIKLLDEYKNTYLNKIYD
ncbi:restriction endonuclease subunit S [Candidatus Hepatoplasma crinochetorum]|uniref:restriction endonuclease subunit S n=1 Tax=Candidatus Hepatoplasma crinochetorum TaxID=295596 RepID=UPI003088ABB9|nr:MAG: hypothetical protein HCTKY_2350 [Candidatus Hepatoplasma crinochetorum]